MQTQSKASLNISIVGAGVAGLAAAIALAQSEHHVTVYEGKKELSEFGAGIQLMANGTRVIHAFGLQDEFKKVANAPEVMQFCRWQDGSVVGELPHNPQETWLYGYPQWQVYRPDLQRLLHEGAVRAGVKILFGKQVVDIDTDKGTFTLADGSKVESDLIVAADGIQSRARQFLPQTANVKPTPHSQHVYRTVIPIERLAADPVTADLTTGRVSYIWAGPDCAVLGYRIASGTLYNFLVSVTRPSPDAEVGLWNQPGDINEMRRLLNGWEPVVQAVAAKVDSCAIWAQAEIREIETYVSESGRFAMVGDAAHALLPHLGQGGNQALEDAASLALFLATVSTTNTLPRAMAAWSRFRQDRIEHLRRMASSQAGVLILPDGEAQRHRDMVMTTHMKAAREDLARLGLEGIEQKLKSRVKPEMDPEAPAVTSPGGREYVYGYDVFAEAEKAVREQSEVVR